MQHIEVVVGGQFGSEAKGHMTAQLVKQAVLGGASDDVQVINIRVAGPNAGHTAYDEAGNEFKFRALPVGAIVDDEVLCYIAPGSEVQMSVLLAELELARDTGHDPKVAVSGMATLLEDHHIEEEQARNMHEKIGSTAKGIGAARADRIMRTARRVKDSPEALEQLADAGINVIEPSEFYTNDVLGLIFNQHIIIEGTQGYGLGLHTDNYPQVTSSDCTALDFLAMAQLPPWRGTVRSLTVWVVARAFPIRVAGNSGPMKGETSWEGLHLPEERTTVTNKVRRVGEWDPDLLRAAVQANGGPGVVQIALTMADQIIPEIKGFGGSEADLRTYPLTAIKDLEQWALRCATDAGAPVGAITTSPTSVIWLEMSGGYNA